MAAKKLKRKAKPRPNARVVESEERAKASTKQLDRGTVSAQAIPLEGEVIISAQIAETVPVAQYANVILGPTQISWKLTGVDMELLVDVDWEDELTDEQQAAYDRVYGALTASQAVLENHLREDREIVYESIRQYNEKLEEDENKKKK